MEENNFLKFIEFLKKGGLFYSRLRMRINEKEEGISKPSISMEEVNNLFNQFEIIKKEPHYFYNPFPCIIVWARKL